MVSKSISTVNDKKCPTMITELRIWEEHSVKPGSGYKYHHETIPHIFHMLLMLLLHNCQYHD